MRTISKIQKPLYGSVKPKLDTGDGMTEQAHKNQCDMNLILREYQRTGFIRHSKENEGKYDDISVQDFQEAMFVVSEATNLFNSLPSALRGEFKNDPAQFLDFAQNPDNAEKLQNLGVIRGNDGFDIKGALSGAPTKQQVLDEQIAASLAAKQEPKATIPAGDDKPSASAD